ncbi:tetratricopeptide repeat protein [Streptomyces sp. NPDC101393]|uniref:tetratricopeptide repeat protein n=1 Tax=Streptomyces sp. NPDC101393 TaxID=3366141 RepID=UPI00381C6B11
MGRPAEALHRARRRADRREGARAWVGLGAADLNAGRSGSAVVRLTTALEQTRPLDDNWLVAMGLGLLGLVHHGQGRHDDALACFTTARAHAETNGRPA